MADPIFRLEASFDDRTGEPVAAYLRVRKGKVSETKEVAEGVAYADYDDQGLLLGIELLGPCEVEVLDQIAKSEPPAISGFLRTSPPRGLVLMPAVA